MKIILIAAIFGLSFTSFRSYEETSVYICNGKSSTKYHLSDTCKGLEKCSTEVEKISLKKAKELKRSLCGWED